MAELSKELAVKEKELAVASKKADVVVAEVTTSATAAEKVKKQVQVVKDKAQSIVDFISVSNTHNWWLKHILFYVNCRASSLVKLEIILSCCSQ